MSNANATGMKGSPLPEDLRRLLREAVESEGMAAVCKRTRASRNALTQGLAGLHVYPGTEALVRAGLSGSRHEHAA